MTAAVAADVAGSTGTAVATSTVSGGGATVGGRLVGDGVAVGCCVLVGTGVTVGTVVLRTTIRAAVGVGTRAGESIRIMPATTIQANRPSAITAPIR